MIFFWSLVAFALLGVLLWLIFVANDDTVLKTMRIPTSGDVDGDGDVDADDLAATKTATHGATYNAPFRVAAMEAQYDAAADVAAASAAVAEAAEASMEAQLGDAKAIATAQDALDAADAAVAEAAEAIQEAAEAIDATTDKAVDSSVAVEAAAESEIVAAASEVAEADDAVRAVVIETEAADVTGALPIVADAINNYPDNLTKIAGIGAVYQKRLYEAGVFTWSQVATTGVEQLSTITEATESANAADWPSQASALAEANGRVGAVYVGPMPDRLIVLPGIGEGAEQVLHEHGLVTYAQIAETDPAVLASVLKTAGSRADAAEVVAAARELEAKSA